jgi:hypothetical protein
MKLRSLYCIFGLLFAAGLSHAAQVTYSVTVFTTSLAGSAAGGWIDLEFNQANAGTSLAGLADVYNFQQTGYTLGAATQTTPGVTGTFEAPPVEIPNSVGGVNFYTREVLTWGSSFSFLVDFSGPIIGGTAPDPSDFFVFLFNPDFSSAAGPLPSGAIAQITFNGDGSITPTGSAFADVSAGAGQTPEPASILFVGGGLAAVLLRRRARYFFKA